MKSLIVLSAAVVAATALGGCKKAADGTLGVDLGHHQKGRYEGVGVYEPQGGWSRLTDAQQPNGPAKTADDQAVIVTIDSDTGEMRACGDLSGYCVGMNPWNKDLVAAQKSPVKVAPGKDDITAADTTPGAAPSHK